MTSVAELCIESHKVLSWGSRASLICSSVAPWFLIDDSLPFVGQAHADTVLKTLISRRQFVFNRFTVQDSFDLLIV